MLNQIKELQKSYRNKEMTTAKFCSKFLSILIKNKILFFRAKKSYDDQFLYAYFYPEGQVSYFAVKSDFYSEINSFTKWGYTKKALEKFYNDASENHLYFINLVRIHQIFNILDEK